MTDFFKAQMDYIFFFYGLSFFVLGVICFAFFKEKNEREIKLPLQFFGLFALLHGLSEWLDLLAVSLFENRMFNIIRLTVMALSFLFLFEFARYSSAENPNSKLRTLNYWIYIPVVVFAASGAWFGIEGANATVRYFIGLVSALSSGWIFYKTSRHESDQSRHYLIIMAAALGAYGMFTGLVVPASELPPAKWINNDTFIKYIGVPVQFFRALCAFAISLAFVFYHLNIRKKDILNIKHASRRALFTFTFIISLVLIVIAGWFATEYIGSRGKQVDEKEGRLKNEIFLEHLSNEMQSVDHAAILMSMSPRLAEAMIKKQMKTLNETVDWFRKTMDVSVCYLLDRKGVTIASSNRNAPDSFVGKSYGFRPYFQHAIKGSHGRYFALGKTSLERGFYSSFPVRDKKRNIIGAAVIKINISSIESSIQKHQYAFLTSPDGIIFMSSSPAFLFKSLWPVDDKKKAKLIASSQFGKLTFETVLNKEPVDNSYIFFMKKHFFVSRLPVGTDNWSLIFFERMINHSIYRMAGIVIIFTLCVFMIAPFYLLMKTEKMRESAEQLARLNQEYRFLVESSSDFIYRRNAKGEFAYVSPSVKAITGYSQDEWMKHHTEYLTNNPVNWKIIERAGDTPGSGRELFPHEMEIYHKDNRKITIEIREQPVIESGKAAGIIGNARDITERKKADEAILAAAREWSASFDAMSDGVSIHSADYTIINVNQSLCKILGKTAEEMIGKKCYQIFHGKDCPIADCPFKILKETSKKTHAEIFEPKLNKWVVISTSPIFDASGSMVRIVHAVSDITERRSLENQLRHAQKMEGIGTLAGGVAHDFNNILTTIIGFGNLALMKMAEDNPLRLNIENMLEAADRAAQLTKSLLLFSRKQVSERKPVDINEIIRRVEKFLKQAIGEDIECKTILHDRQILVLADSNQIEQVLMNLATNARDAMSKGGSFTIQVKQVNLDEDFIAAHGYGSTGVYAVIVVSDTGKGMDEETCKRIFEPFFTTKEVGKGTGLGLAMVYGIVKQHDGYINVYSESGKGSTFRIYLPVITAKPQEETGAAQEEAPARGTETVLLAEDDALLRHLSKTVLTEHGYKVITANDGADAVRKFRENKDAIQLLLFDLIMPKMNGKEAYDEIQKIKPGMKAIFVTGYAPDLVHQKVSLETNAMLIFKPISPFELLKKLRSALDEKTG